MGQNRNKEILGSIENARIYHPGDDTHQPAVMFKTKKKGNEDE